MYNTFTLGNGLRVVVENIDYVKSVSVGLWIENGSRNENKFNNGISHFIEHMFFKGTKRRTAKRIAEDIEDIGGQINAFTGKEATCYYIKVLDNHLELSLDILSDMLFNSNFYDEDIEKEKGVVIEEINMNEDSPEDVLMDLHSKAIWGEDSISLPILGTIDTVRSFNHENILNYVYSHYIPENCVLSIAGKVDFNEIKKIIDNYFGQWKVSQKKITNYSKPIINDYHLYKKKNIEQLHFSLGINGIETGNDKLYSLLLLNNIFGGGASSRLFQKVREEYGYCYSIYSYISSYINTGIISIYCGLNQSYILKVLEIIYEEINDFIKIGVTEEKLIKVKEQIKANYVLGLESTSSRMFNNGKSLLFLNKIKTADEVIININNITKNSINEVMEETFNKGILNSSFVGECSNFDKVTDFFNKSTPGFKNPKTKNV